MKNYRILLPVALLALINLLASSGQFATAATKKGTPLPPVDPRNLIHAVDTAAGTVEIEYMRNKETRTYTVDGITTITVNNCPGKLSDVKTGMQVRDYVERDGHTLDSITVDNADPPPATPKKA